MRDVHYYWSESYLFNSANIIDVCCIFVWHFVFGISMLFATLISYIFWLIIYVEYIYD